MKDEMIIEESQEAEKRRKPEYDIDDILIKILESRK